MWRVGLITSGSDEMLGRQVWGETWNSALLANLQTMFMLLDKDHILNFLSLTGHRRTEKQMLPGCPYSPRSHHVRVVLCKRWQLLMRTLTHCWWGCQMLQSLCKIFGCFLKWNTNHCHVLIPRIIKWGIFLTCIWYNQIVWGRPTRNICYMMNKTPVLKSEVLVKTPT